jgi:hypothetical protein
MADIALVSLALDSTAVVAGEKQATRALQNVDSAMQRTEKQAATLNTSLNANLKRSGDSFKSLGDGASKAGSALQSLGGPVGRVAGEITNLGGQMQGLTGSFGLLGGAAIGAVAGVAALGSALVSLTLAGAEVSDGMLDVAESTGLSVDQVQRLSAAARLAGESADFVERSFRAFQNVLQSALNDPTSEAAQSLKVLGINASEAARDVGAAFIDAVAHVKEYRGTSEGAVASTQVLGKGVESLSRLAGGLTDILKGTRQELEDGLIVASAEAVQAAGRLDEKINKLDNSWTVFKQNLAGTSFGSTISNTLDGVSSSLDLTFLGLQKIERLVSQSRYLQVLLGFAKSALNPVGLLAPLAADDERAGPPDSGWAIKATATLVAAAKKAPKAVTPITEFTPEQIGDPFKRWTAARERDAQDAEAAWAAVQIRRSNVTTEWLELLRILSSGVEQLVPPSGSPIQAGGPGQPFPGAPIFGGLPPPSSIRTEEQARLDEQFTAIFDDMLISILTAQKTLGEAFGGLALGIVDTFAAEFTKSLHKEFITPMVQELTNLLQSALKDLFGGLSAGGVKGFFGGLVKGIGTIFGGFFASGGTLGPGKFGIAGERGPELIFAGNQPMHIAPVTAGSAGNVFNISVGVNAPSGTVDKRTQDQLAATVMNAVKRAQRNEGAR